MQTEIRFLLDLVLNHKLPAEAKKLCLERIGDVEASLVAKPMVHAPIRMPTTEQAPSTQRLLDAHEAPVIATAPVAAPVMKRIVGGEVSTGSGTKGPRKF